MFLTAQELHFPRQKCCRWEMAFDEAEEAVAQEIKPPGQEKLSVAEVLLDFLVLIIVVPAWQHYIVPTAVELKSLNLHGRLFV